MQSIKRRIFEISKENLPRVICLTLNKTLQIILYIYKRFFLIKYIFFPLSIFLIIMGWACIILLTPWKSVIPVFSLSPVKNLGILLYFIDHFKYFTRSPSSLYPANASESQLIVSDVFYDGANNRKRILDVYYSEHEALKPIIILVYSVNWSFDKKEKWRNWARIVESNGYVVIIPEFTSIENGKLFQMAYDFLKCLQWVVNNAVQFRGDVKRIYALGVETGAHLVMHCILDSIYNRMHAFMIKGFILPQIYGVVLYEFNFCNY